jgi:hypothetical protein
VRIDALNKDNLMMRKQSQTVCVKHRTRQIGHPANQKRNKDDGFQSEVIVSQVRDAK